MNSSKKSRTTSSKAVAAIAAVKPMADITITVSLDRLDDEAGLDYVVELANVEIRKQNENPDNPQLPEFDRRTYLERQFSIVIESYKQQYLSALAQKLVKKYVVADVLNRAEADAALADVVVPGGGGEGGGGRDTAEP